MRVAFTIILNGLRHLKHKDYYKKLIDSLDYWVIVEGVALPTGSTSWCKELPDSMHNNYLSNDGTTEFLDSIKGDKVRVIRCIDKPWNNKDEQVNAAIEEIKKITNECFLWQIDCDEQWTADQFNSAEKYLKEKNGKTGCFLCNYYVGVDRVAIGEWGEGVHEPYRRLWDWKGESFESHEPPRLKGGNGVGLLLPIKFNHYAYYFEEDVKFKEQYYGGYDGLYERWKKIQTIKSPIHIRYLLGEGVWWSQTRTIIKYLNDR